MTHKIWLIRHGQSEGNAQSIRQGQSNYDLTALGKEQISALANSWSTKKIDFELIVSSPQSRALQSARIISQHLNVEIVTDDRWQERNSGEAEGTPLAQVTSAAQTRPRKYAHEPIFRGGESDLQLHVRAANALQGLLSKDPGNYLVVSHGGTLNAALHVILGMIPSGKNSLPRFSFSNSGYALVHFDTNRHQWLIEKINASDHLPMGD